MGKRDQKKDREKDQKYQDWREGRTLGLGRRPAKRPLKRKGFGGLPQHCMAGEWQRQQASHPAAVLCEGLCFSRRKCC